VDARVTAACRRANAAVRAAVTTRERYGSGAVAVPQRDRRVAVHGPVTGSRFHGTRQHPTHIRTNVRKEVNTMTFITREELAREEVELLPSRETLAFFNWANVSATNVAVAQNTYTLLSAAAASANQAVLVSQS
jgi:hypothetical protein